MPCGTLSSGEGNGQVLSTRVKTWFNGGAPEVTTAMKNQRTEHKETTGECIPNFHKRKRAGELLPHTFFLQDERWGEGHAKYLVEKRDSNDQLTNRWEEDYWLRTDWSWFPTRLEVESKVPEDLDYYVQQAAAEIYSSGHDTLTFLTELTKTKDMFKGFAVKLRDFVKNPKVYNQFFRDGSWKRRAMGEWLNWRYGVRPLKYDLEDLYDAVINLNDTRTRFSERKGTTLKFSELYQSSGEYLSSYHHTVVRDEIEISLRGSVTADINLSSFQFNPVRTAWELLPGSFLLDWAVNVGQAIEAMSFLLLASDYKASSGYDAIIRRTHDHGLLSWKTGYSGQFYRTYNSWRRVTKRIPATVSLPPQLALNLNTYKVLDLWAITLRAFNRR